VTYRQPVDVAEAQAAIDAGVLYMRGRRGMPEPAKVWQDQAGPLFLADYLIPSDFGEAG
jgi:hypothetical protein